MINSRAVGLFFPIGLSLEYRGRILLPISFPRKVPFGVSFPQPYPDLHCNVPASVPHPSFPSRDGHPVPVRSICVAVQPLLPVQKKTFHIIRLFHSRCPDTSASFRPLFPDDHIFAFPADRILVAVLRNATVMTMIICSITIHRDGNRFYVMFQYLRPSGRIQRSRMASLPEMISAPGGKMLASVV